MLHLDSDTNYYWYDGAVDFRKGFDGLCGVVQEFLRREVTDGGVFIFVNRRRNAIKLLKWEGDGLAIYHKRIEQGVFKEPVKSSNGKEVLMDAQQLTLILQGIRLSSVVQNKRYKWRA
jgi:transposase